MKPLGHLILFLHKHDFINEYAALLGFNEIFKNLSRIYEIDLCYKAQGFIEGFQKEIEHLNMELRHVTDQMEDAIHAKHGTVFFMEIFINDMLFCLKEIKPSFKDEAVRHYLDEFKSIFGNEFQ